MPNKDHYQSTARRSEILSVEFLQHALRAFLGEEDTTTALPLPPFTSSRFFYESTDGQEDGQQWDIFPHFGWTNDHFLSARHRNAGIQY